jgi:glycosyltransferase involved in cell wall biosynthesis
MKVLYHVNYPLAWARGGFTTQIRETKRQVESFGVKVEWLRHDATDEDRADIMHYWGGSPSDMHWQMAKKRGCRIVLSCLHGRDVIRPRWVWSLKRRLYFPLVRQVLRGLSDRLGYGVYRAADAVCVVTPYEREYVHRAFGAPLSRIHVVENGCDEFMKSPCAFVSSGDYLIVLGYISATKYSVELARQAKSTHVPMLFVGGAQTRGDAYYAEFVAEVDGQWVRHETDLDPDALAARIRAALGGVLISRYESCGIAILDYLAAGLPVLCRDLPNLRDYYGNRVQYAGNPTTPSFAAKLRRFYETAHRMPDGRTPARVPTWPEAGAKMKAVYDSVMRGAQADRNGARSGR